MTSANTYEDFLEGTFIRGRETRAKEMAMGFIRMIKMCTIKRPYSMFAPTFFKLSVTLTVLEQTDCW